MDRSGIENALVTGATSGIGEACAVRLAECGARHVFFCGRDEARLAAVAEKIRAAGAEPHPRKLDVADADAVRAWLEEADAVAPLDLVFANAGIASPGPDEASQRRTFAVDVGGVANTVLPAIALYRKPGVARAARRLALTSSITGYHGMPQCPAYSASKAFVKAWGAALRGSLRREGVSVTTVCPGFVRSRITDANTCPMPFFMEAPAAARVIVRGIAKGRGLVAFPWPMRFSMWLLSALPEALSERLFRLLPEKA